MIDPIIISTALIAGMLARAARLPALIGYLAAGFVLHEMQVEGGEALQIMSEIGITLLLFTIGLKLQVRDLLATRIWGTTLLHMAATQLFFLLVLLAAGWIFPNSGL
ncbi:MAG: cation:proton antiporter, partial [Chromatocurvus sp.]